MSWHPGWGLGSVPPEHLALSREDPESNPKGWAQGGQPTGTPPQTGMRMTQSPFLFPTRLGPRRPGRRVRLALDFPGALGLGTADRLCWGGAGRGQAGEVGCEDFTWFVVCFQGKGFDSSWLGSRACKKIS